MKQDQNRDRRAKDKEKIHKDGHTKGFHVSMTLQAVKS